MLTPLDIHQMEFRVVWRGYDREQVDEFMDTVLREYEELYRENEELKKRVSELEARLEDFAKLASGIRETLAFAEDAAKDKIRAAETTAEALVRDARSRVREMIEKARQEVDKELNRLEEARARGRSFRIQLRSILRSYLDLLEDLESLPELKVEEASSVAEAAAGNEDEAADHSISDFQNSG